MERDRSDAMWAVKLTALSKEVYEEKWPDGSGKSLSENRSAEAYWDKPDQVIVGEFYWIEEKPVEIIQMNNGSVYREDEIALIVDELAQAGITEKSRRTRPERICKVRHLDGGGWLDDEQETVFNWIPIIPIYGNFNIIENKIVWRSAIEKLKDAQRIYNYARSRQIEEGALTPRDKTWMTREQGQGNEQQLRTMNTNSDPVQFYNHIDGQPAPFRPGAAMPNPSLEGTANAAMNDIVQGSGLFSASMGDNPGLQSGIAIEQLQERGDTGTLDYFEALEIAIAHTAKILVDAVPKVYDTQRQVRVLSEDGTFSMEMVNRVVVDNQTGQPVVLNDLSKGRYEVNCSVGKSFKSRQQEAVASILEIANIDPTVITEGGDILLNSMSAPGLDLIAERKRQQLFNAGLIPQSQLNEQEQQQAAQEPQQPDAATILAQAEMLKAQADMAEAQLKQQDQQIRMAELQQKAQMAQGDQQLKAASLQQTGQKDAISASQKQQEFDLKIQQMQQDLALKLEENDRKNTEAMREMQLAQQDLVRMQAETLKTLREAMGADAIVNPSTIAAYNKQSNELL